MIRAGPSEQEECLRLLAPLAFQLSTRAVVLGANPGDVYVDRPGAVGAVFVVGSEGAYLAGRPDAATTSFVRTAFERGPLDEWYVVATPAWVAALADVFAPRPPIALVRCHYELACVELRAAPAPRGYSIRPVDRALLASAPPPVANWVRGSWASDDDFLARGAGAVATCDADDEVVSWSLADCAADARVEIGVATLPAHRRRGLAAACARAAIVRAAARGIDRVGWQTNDFNHASRKTAERLGFRLERRYTMHYAVRDEDDHAHHLAASRHA